MNEEAGNKEDWIITYPDGLVINLKDRPSEEWEPCNCGCHKHPKGEMVHIVQCCFNGWKKKKNESNHARIK